MLSTNYQSLIHLSRYARWDDNKDRRETWDETVSRYFSFFVPYLNENHGAGLASSLTNRLGHPDGPISDVGRLRNAVLNLDVMPSMRCLMTAGDALARDHIAGYNCSYRPVDDIRAFDEILFILMCSTGVGFSVERQYVNQLPAVPERLDESTTTITVRDSKRGWAEGYRELLGLLYAGRIPSWDMSKVRGKGARLFTMGGTASGPQPLVELFEFTIRLFLGSVGRRLSSLECHDLVCMIGECVVVGGVRRSALLSLSNLSDQRMRDAKSGEWYELTPWRRISNNSVAYTEKPETGQFMEEWISLYHSKSGERGIFNREAAREQAMKSGRRKGYQGNGVGQVPIDFGTNPCSEIILRPKQFCNLSTIVARENDTVETLTEKVRLAAILGTWQSCLTNFRYITKAWQKNCEEERLLGVSMTGIMGNPLLAGRTKESWKRLPDLLEYLKETAVATNKEWAERLGVSQATAVTCVKPEGCRPMDAVLTTDQGIFVLGEIDYSGGQWTDSNGMSGEYGRIVKNYKNGVANILALDLNFGVTLKATPNHQWMVHKKGWTRTDDIEIGDEIVINLNAYKNTAETSLSTPSDTELHFNTNLDVRLPKMMSPDLAWLLGYILGDGAMCEDKARFRFTDGYELSIRKAARLFKTLFNLSGNVRELNDRKAFCLEIASKKLWSFFEENGLKKQKNRIPLKVRQSSVESIAAFFSGLLDSDGHAKNGKASLTTADDALSDHIQHVALSIGLVFGRSRNINRSGAFSNNHMWLMALSWGQCSDTREYLKKHSLKMYNWTPPKGNSRSSIYKLGRVRSIRSIGAVPTFDVETEQHWFWAGAFMSHNTATQLVGVDGSGIHPIWSRYHIRRIREDKDGPVAQMLVANGFPYEVDSHNPKNLVFDFPRRAPKSSVLRKDISAIEQLEHWKVFQDHWCEHKPSITVYAREKEWPVVGGWVFDNFNQMSGVSFLPYSDHIYKQAPYEEISESKYRELVANMPDEFNMAKELGAYESEDRTTSSHELACVAGSCEI